MAKLKPKNFYSRIRSNGSMGIRSLGVQVTLQSTGKSFRSCARVKSKIMPHSFNAPKGYYVCAANSNPRKAMAGALRALAKKVGKRKGAFAGI